ncbi:WecB/TagA/CpsF family glycosyltransferase [Patescibacteria group bacterium]|nr:WecB/TagA/CpsF family glycosyltransferase [Patescibacteria group bacterium]
MISKANILGVSVQGFQASELLNALRRDLSEGKRAQVVTMTNEMLMAARRDPEHQAVLNHAHYRIADSVGLVWASAFLAKPLMGWFKWLRAYWRAWWMLVGLLFRPKHLQTVLPGVIRGSELTLDLAKLCAEGKHELYLLGAGPGVAVEAARRLQKKFPGLEVTADPSDPKPGHEQTQVERINRKKARVVLVAYGVPEQDQWINRNLEQLSAPVIAMGVGGTLDYLAGGKSLKGGGPAKQPPGWMRKIGLEWLWRLFTQPSRTGRIFMALPRFVHAVVRQKLDQRLDN